MKPIDSKKHDPITPESAVKILFSHRICMCEGQVRTANKYVKEHRCRLNRRIYYNRKLITKASKMKDIQFYGKMATAYQRQAEEWQRLLDETLEMMNDE